MLKALLSCLFLVAIPSFATDATYTAANAINSLGLDLLIKATQPGQNALLSPYSIQAALAMTYAGADGNTRDEMARVLHFPEDDKELHNSFETLRLQLNAVTEQSAKEIAKAKKRGWNKTPITIAVAGRLFGQTGYDFRPDFLDLLKNKYAAPLETIDFAKNPTKATERINQWVEKQTQERIHNLIPDAGLNNLTRLVLLNAVYFRATWLAEFEEYKTKRLPFRCADGTRANVQTMNQMHSFGYEKRNGYVVVTLPYRDARLQFLILLPDTGSGLAELEKKLTAKLLADCAKVGGAEIRLYLPRLKFEPTTLALGQALQTLGMKGAFNDSANFERMAAPRKDSPLFVSDVFHKTFFSLNEHETEAAASTGADMARLSAYPVSENLIEVRVDRPFVFAVLHRDSGACLFLGRMVDPR